MIFYPKENKMELKLEEEYTRFFKMILDLLNWGEEKHKEDSFQQLIKLENFERTFRLNSSELASHSVKHWHNYLDGEVHDHFKTLEYQLAAAAVNPLMEFVILQKEKLQKLKEENEKSSS